MAEGRNSLEVKFDLKRNSFCTLYGKSGVGKTTLLKILAGLIQPEKGYIEVNGQVWLDTEKKINLAPSKREIGFVFQDYALFPNMTVRENLQFALKDKQDKAIIDNLLELVSLTQLAQRKPQTLSGGQQQRVALIRALVRQPQLLLLDEPLSALDLEMRQSLQTEILRLHPTFNTTTLMVSHALPEIYRLSDQIIWLEDGKVLKQGSPATVFGQKQLSSKIQLTGEILAIMPSDVVYILDILVGNTVIKVVATTEEINGLQLGDQVTIFSKAFNPIIKR